MARVRGLFVVLLVALPWAITPRRISKNSCSTTATFYLIAEDAALEVATLSEQIANSIEDCIDLCVDVNKCKAVNTHDHQNGKLDCHLLQYDHLSNPKSVKSKVGWKLYNTGSKDLTRKVGPRCSSMINNPCPSPCTCIDSCDSYYCDCNDTVIFPSCKDALASNVSEQLHWIAHPTMKAALQVTCEKKTDGSVVALISHNSEATIKVTGYETKGSYKRDIIYNANKIEDIAKFVDTSSSCKQFLKIQCHGMGILAGGVLVKDRAGRQLEYLGGGPLDGTGCACGITNTCVNNRYKCNCDINTAPLYYDEGFFTDKSVLPITQIQLGDTGNEGEYGTHTLGKLECIE